MRLCGRGGGSGVFPATAVTQHNAPAAPWLRPATTGESFERAHGPALRLPLPEGRI
ncbi:hypothetical protein T261_06809 [Streptomyces lydicus]|nr:hypothetical protein T261_06809 [Streptomyces lydicus]